MDVSCFIPGISVEVVRWRKYYHPISQVGKLRHTEQARIGGRLRIQLLVAPCLELSFVLLITK